jgi:hypothetical protein
VFHKKKIHHKKNAEMQSHGYAEIIGIPKKPCYWDLELDIE